MKSKTKSPGYPLGSKILLAQMALLHLLVTIQMALVERPQPVG